MFQGFLVKPSYHTSSYAISPVASLATSTAPAACSLQQAQHQLRKAPVCPYMSPLQALCVCLSIHLDTRRGEQDYKQDSSLHIQPWQCILCDRANATHIKQL